MKGNEVDLDKLWAGILEDNSMEANKKKGEQANEALKDDEGELDTLWAEDR